jgi:hypothetical protein
VIPWWNAFTALTTYLVVVWQFTTVRSLQLEMQERVRQRTAALTAEIGEREQIIGGEFLIEAPAAGGMIVHCRLPDASASA